MPHDVNTPRIRNRLATLSLLLGLSGACALASWEDKSAGMPLIQSITAKEMGADGQKWITLQDKLGRLFVGGDQLHVFDGNAWQSFAISNSYGLRALAFGQNGLLWAGAINELGYFEEKSVGTFEYHSLVPNLPKEEQLIGDVWGCAIVGHNVYFVCRDRVLRWNGSTFQIWHYEGLARLLPLKMGNEFWFHHVETGLYRITNAGPEQVIPATQLPRTGILGLARDQHGLVIASANGFYRPGSPSKEMFSDELNKLIVNSKLVCFVTLENGNYAIGTLNSGLIFVSKTGELLRVFLEKDGLPTRAIYSLALDSSGHVWCTTPNGIFRLESNGHLTLHGPLTGLDRPAILSVSTTDSKIYAASDTGSFSLKTTGDGSGRFERLQQLTQNYSEILPDRKGLLLARHGGIDFFDGLSVSPVVSAVARTFFGFQASLAYAESFYVVESFGIGLLVRGADGSLAHTHLLEMPDQCSSLQDDAKGNLWIGTFSKGAFIFDPKSRSLLPICDSISGARISGRVLVTAFKQRILLFYGDRVLQSQSDGIGTKPLNGLPNFTAKLTTLAPDKESMLVAFEKPAALNDIAQGLGVLDFDSSGQIRWQELDASALHSIGFIRDMDFTEENGRPILWVGGTEGLLRIDYDTLQPVQPPRTPIVLLDTAHSSDPGEKGTLSFPFRNHQVSLKTFTGDYAHGKDWLIQTRLGPNSDWSAPSTRRSFEFSNLSEGDYHFEVRAVNSANLTSAPAAFSFSILPPWYRSRWAYSGYAAGLAAAALGFVRIRDRRIRHRNRELESMVERRTAELVKANAAKDEFLASISHEIRNPMNGVLGIADSFPTDTLDPASRHKFGLLRQCASHLSALLEDILDFSRVQAGADDLEAKPFNLRELVESIAAITAAASEEAGLPVETAVSPVLPQQLSGDARRVRQILLNFVGNALKYAGRGQVNVTVWGKPAGPGRVEVFFAVSDEGPGIAAPDQEKLFTRFERGPGARFGRVPGSGLGLALCRALAKKMGGRVWLESEVGEGSSFYFSAPFTAVDEPAAAAGTFRPPGTENYRTALVVDDEEYNRVALAGLLETLGFSVQTAASGEEARALAGRHDFDLHFLDFALPGLTGPELARAIRQESVRAVPAVIFAVTAFNTPDKRAQCLAAGMDAFLSKPVTMERLRGALAGVAAQPADDPSASSLDPTHPLAGLRLLADRKRVPFAEELARYFSDLEAELEQLTVALQQEVAAQAVHYSHLLRGRCAFIREHELELALHKTGTATAEGRWDEARQLGREVRTRLAELRLRLSSLPPDAPPGSGR